MYTASDKPNDILSWKTRPAGYTVIERAHANIKSSKGNDFAERNAVPHIAIRKELLIPIVCGIFLAENLSVIMQVSYFKYTKKKFGEGRRIFRMSPLHHHYQKGGFHEAKIVTRFWIVGIMLAVLTFVTLKLR